MTTFGDLVKRPTPEELRSRLASAHVDALIHLTAAQSTWSNAVADEVEGFGGSAACVAAEKALHEAKRAEDKARTALEAYDARIRSSAQQVETDILLAQWDKAVKLADARAAAAAKVARSAAEFAADYTNLLRLTGDLTGALPDTPDPDAAWLRASQVETSVRKELIRLDVDWAMQWAWGKPALGEFLEPFRGAVTVVQRWRDAANKKKAS